MVQIVRREPSLALVRNTGLTPAAFRVWCRGSRTSLDAMCMPASTAERLQRRSDQYAAASDTLGISGVP